MVDIIVNKTDQIFALMELIFDTKIVIMQLYLIVDFFYASGLE
jgi:hypothetical protein